VTGTDAFTDTPDGAWYGNAVLWASQQGLISGYGGGRFGPNDPVNREQMTTILWRYAGSPATEGGSDYSDETAVAPYAAAAVDWANVNNIVVPMSNGVFAPKSAATRAPVAAALMNYDRSQQDHPANDDLKMAKRRCYGYKVNSSGGLIIDPDEAQTVRWIFERYLDGDSLGKIANGLERQGILSPTGKAKWSREALGKLLSNEKYTGRVLLQKTISTGISQINNDGLMNRYLYVGTHEAIISDELFQAVQQAKQERSKSLENKFAIDLSL